MSMIKCPDCEEQISSKAKQCIHCGCVFQVCPECEAILVGEHDHCPECGFQFKQEAPAPAPNAENEKSLYQWYMLSKNTSLLNSEKLPSILHRIAFILAALAVFRTYIWGDSLDLDSLLSAKSTYTTIVILYVIGAILWFTGTSLSSFQLHNQIQRFENFSASYNLNLPDLIDKEFKLGFQNVTVSGLEDRAYAIKYALWSIQYKNDLPLKEKDRQGCWRTCIASLIFTATFCIFAAINTKVYMKCAVMDSGFGFGDLEYIWLPIAGIILNFIVSSSGTHAYSAGDEWMEKNMPQHMDDYQHYVVKWADRMLEMQNKTL